MIVDLPIRLKGNSRRTSGNSLSPLGAQFPEYAQNMDASQTLLTEVKLHMYVICDADYTSFVANEGKEKSTSYKQLLDEVSVISGIIKFEVSIISQRSRMISLTGP